MKPATVKVLRELRRAGRGGATTGELGEACGYRFGARILELREAGCVIEQRRERCNQSRYWLRQEPPGLLPSPVPSTPRPPAGHTPPAVEGDGGQLELGLVA